MKPGPRVTVYEVGASGERAVIDTHTVEDEKLLAKVGGLLLDAVAAEGREA